LLNDSCIQLHSEKEELYIQTQYGKDSDIWASYFVVCASSYATIYHH